jgi:hypothetical protein
MKTLALAVLLFATNAFAQWPFTVGQTWTFEDSYGGYTYFQTLARPAGGCDPGPLVDLYITKSPGSRGYWWPGNLGSSVHWVMRHLPDGEWQAVYTTYYTGTPIPAWTKNGHDTFDMRARSPQAYMVIPPLNSKLPLIVNGWADDYQLPGTQTPTCIVDNPKAVKQPVTWYTKFTYEKVSTPIYTGWTICAEQVEGANLDNNPAHEKWYFAYPLGLVEIDSYSHGVKVGYIKRIPGRNAQHPNLGLRHVVRPS